MKTIIKTLFVLFASAALCALLSLPAFAACGGTVVIANFNTGWQQNISGTPDNGTGTGTIFCQFWDVGSAATNNSGTLKTSVIIAAYSTGYYVQTDWGNTGVVGCPTKGDRMAWLYSIANGGTGQYLIMSCVNNASNQYDFDAITNGPGNTPSPIAIPALTISSAKTNGDGTDTATVTWTPIANLLGYYDSAPTNNNIITGVAIRYYNGTVAPSDFTTGSWTLCTTGGSVQWGATGTDPGTATVTFPTPASGYLTYLSMSILFDGQAAGAVNPPSNASGLAPPSPMALGLTETAFVGASSTAIGPTAAGVFSSFAADETSPGKLELTWRSNVENGVAYYQAYSSSSSNGSFLPIDGTKVNALGNGHVYSVDVPMPTRFSTGAIYVKIGAARMDGGESWSDVRTVSTGITPPTGGSNATSNQGGRR